MRTQDRSRATKRISLEDMMEYSAIIDGDWIYEIQVHEASMKPQYLSSILWASCRPYKSETFGSYFIRGPP